MKNTLIHLSSDPFSSLACKEGLDLALVLATFEQAVDLCISGPALSILSNKQNPSSIHGKNLNKLLDGLEFYDIENIFIERQQTLAMPQPSWQGIQALETQQWQQLFGQYQQVFRF